MTRRHEGSLVSVTSLRCRNSDRPNATCWGARLARLSVASCAAGTLLTRREMAVARTASSLRAPGMRQAGQGSYGAEGQASSLCPTTGRADREGVAIASRQLSSLSACVGAAPGPKDLLVPAGISPAAVCVASVSPR